MHAVMCDSFTEYATVFGNDDKLLLNWTKIHFNGKVFVQLKLPLINYEF